MTNIAKEDMKLQLRARRLNIGKHRCERCGKGFSDLIDFQRHVAAEHHPRTLRNIRTTREIAHHPVAK